MSKLQTILNTVYPLGSLKRGSIAYKRVMELREELTALLFDYPKEESAATLMPAFDVCEQRAREGAATPIEQLIRDLEPSLEEEAQRFRTQLYDALCFYYEAKSGTREKVLQEALNKGTNAMHALFERQDYGGMLDFWNAFVIDFKR